MATPFVKNFDDFAENMANPNPNRPIQEAVATFGRSLCDSISNSPTFEKLGPQGLMGAVCKPYWDSQGYSAPVESSQFTGGQCDCARYSVTVNIGDATGDDFRTINSVFGPIGTIRLIDDPPAAGGCGPSLRYFRVVGFNRGIGNASGCQEWAEREYTATCSIGKTLKGVSVVRVDGGQDNCGNPPANLVAGPNPAPNPGPLPPGTGPQLDVRGGVVIVLPPTLEVNPGLTVELPIGEVNLGGGAGGGPAEEPLPGDELEGDGSGTGGGENDFGDPPDGERWVGCCIRITSSPIGAGVIPSSLPHDVYPIVVGNARLKFQGPGGPLTYDTPIQKRQETSCLWEPVRGMAPVGAFVNLLPGYSYTIRPYSVPLEQ